MAGDEERTEARLTDVQLERARRRRIIIAVAVALAVLLVGAGAWAVFGSGRQHADDDKQQTIEPAKPTTPDDSQDETESVVTSSSADASDTAGGGGSGTGQPAQGAGGSTAPGGPGYTTGIREPYVSYRLGGQLYRAREDGSEAVAVGPSAEGVFSLSPDGRSLAYVDLATRQLVLADPDTGVKTTVGAAEQVTPVWAPTSDWLLFVRMRPASAGVQDVYRVARSGGTASALAAGSSAAVSPDGRTVVVARDTAPDAGPVPTLTVIRDGVPAELPVPGAVADVAADNYRAYVAVSHVGGGEAAQDGVWAVPFDGSTPTRIVGPPASTRPLGLGSLLLAPDAMRLSFSATGDDGYSRPAVVGTNGGTPVELSRRRDAYPMRWTADGTALLMIEGNAWQAESTALVRCRADGSGTVVVVSGAGR